MQMQMTEATNAGGKSLQTAAMALTLASSQQSPADLAKSGRQLAMMTERVNMTQDLLNDVTDDIQTDGGDRPDDDSADAILIRAAEEHSLSEASEFMSVPSHAASRALLTNQEHADAASTIN
jgi:hypothetical protein